MVVKKVFALVSVTALSGLVAAIAASGCSSTETITDTPETSTIPDAKLDTKAKETEPDEASGPASCPTLTPITEAEVEAQIKWLPPVPSQTVCTQPDIDSLKALFKSATPGKGIAFADIKKSLGATCSACAFSPIAGPNWQVFVEDKAGAIDNRTGSCFAQLENVECGRKRFNWESCLNAACPTADCADATGKVPSKCKQNAQKAACKDLTTAYAKACPNETTILPICGNIFSAITVSCSGGLDSGIDASTN